MNEKKNCHECIFICMRQQQLRSKRRRNIFRLGYQSTIMDDDDDDDSYNNQKITKKKKSIYYVISTYLLFLNQVFIHVHHTASAAADAANTYTPTYCFVH